MEHVIILAATMLALTLEGIAILVVAIGSLVAVIGMAKGLSSDLPGLWKRQVWLNFAAWIVLALEFALAADIVRTAVAPNWEDIGKLAAIAAVRTVLNFFLWRDLDEFESPGDAAPLQGSPMPSDG